MKLSARHFTQAFLESAQDLPEEQIPAAMDAALALLRRQGIPFAAFRRELKRQLPRFDTTVRARLETPVAASHAEAAALEKILKDSLGRPVAFQAAVRAPLLGGAVLTVGDDRFDYSIRGALDGARRMLRDSSAAL